MKKQSKPIFWLSGNYYDCKKTWNLIVRKIKDSLGDPNVISIDCGFNTQDSDPASRVAQAADICRLIRTNDIFDRRPRIIRMLGLPPDYSDILDSLKFVRDDNVLVIDSPIGYYKNKSFVSAANSNFYKHINENGRVCNYDSRAENQKAALSWLKTLSSDYNRKISNEVLSFLIEVKGLDLDSLYCELMKLFDYSSKEITIEDIKECCIPVFERLIWEFVDLIYRQRFDEALKYTEEFIDNASSLTLSKRQGLMEQTIGVLTQSFEALIHAKDGCKTSLSYEGLWKAMEGLKKKKDQEWVDRFSKGFCFSKLKDTAFQLAYGWPKSKIYSCWVIVRHLHSRLRYEPVNFRCGLTAICMFVCGKISDFQALIVGGYSPEEAEEIIRGY